ncbi:iron-siderophore ABC transporter substrate-binding protein [Tsukamurella sp. 8F]|uniref:iron-siderophore ABC transporter substrate-binding protein n=1 Tax=unclassified Tsukamurella TaxID=2633480 RepID=UPI0023BA0CD9|nr:MULTISPECIES: iron-siderophore ABC transporter substrate-binding protein [unclassified Tsukamurella]MDF0528760.1 iron-siderophore ABC transporter substrate-binding protein [Tsukamurella sp. 8J]MDF0586595.1 iron-siderophore ABC transporter substrate-binding protein [Tsukamurella sp. 8F]
MTVLGKVRVVLAAGVTTALLVAGCSSGGGAGPESTAPSGAFPVTIDSSLGKVKIDSEPKRVVTLGWGSTEAAVALGVVPVGMRNMKGDSGTPDGIVPWIKDGLGGAHPTLLDESSESIPYEKIAALRPDVILAVQSGLTDDQYAQLGKIAPTVAFPGKAWQTSWQDQTTIAGKALGREAKAKELVDKTEAQLAKVKSEHPEFAGKTVAATGAVNPDSLAFYFDTDPRVSLLTSIGFTALPALTKLREAASPGKFATMVSWENLAQYTPDVLTTWFNSDSVRNAVSTNPVFAGLAPVQRKAYVPLTDPALVFAVSSPNVLDIPWLLNRYVPQLSAAAKAAG